MGIKNVGKCNAALLAKWIWRFGWEEKGVWRDIIESRYGSCRDLRLRNGDRKASAWWQDLGKVCDIHNQSNWFLSRVNWKLRDGNRIRFSEDRWISDGPLKEKFPRLYLISLCKDKVISEVGEWANIGGSETCTWNLS